MIWGDVSRLPQTLRYETLSNELALCGLEQSFEAWPLGEDSLESHWPAIEAKGFAQLRLGRDEGMSIGDITREVPRLVSLLKCADALVTENGKWVARNFFHDAMVEIMVQEVKGIDFTGEVLIVGAGCEARVLAFALSQIGFHKMTISAEDETEMASLLTDLRRTCFGVEFKSIRASQLTQLAATHALAVNTLSIEGTKPLANELSYFNFLQLDGVWIETSSESIDSPLVQEAKDLELQTITSLDVMSHVDALWAKACFNVTIDRARYLKTWTEKLSKTTA